MDNYKSNSFKSKQTPLAPAEEPAKAKTEKVIRGTAKVKKKNEVQKLASSIISEDVSNVTNYIFKDVLIPSIKDALYDIVVNGAKMMLFGENAGPSSRRSGSTNSRVSYRSYYDNGRQSSGNSIPKKSGYDFDPIIFDNRGDAEYTLDKMHDIVNSEYQVVSVMDMYCAAGIDCPYTYDSYGWTSLAGAEIIKVRDGWMIKLPKALPLK